MLLKNQEPRGVNAAEKSQQPEEGKGAHATTVVGNLCAGGENLFLARTQPPPLRHQ